MRELRALGGIVAVGLFLAWAIHCFVVPVLFETGVVLP
jgi:hypothetical protein